jgi:hypothetical protein
MATPSRTTSQSSTSFATPTLASSRPVQCVKSLLPLERLPSPRWLQINNRSNSSRRTNKKHHPLHQVLPHQYFDFDPDSWLMRKYEIHQKKNETSTQ